MKSCIIGRQILVCRFVHIAQFSDCTKWYSPPECQRSRQPSKYKFSIMLGTRSMNRRKRIYPFQNKTGTTLATQGILTYWLARPQPYHLYADECALLVLPPLVSLSKYIDRLTGCIIRCSPPDRRKTPVLR